MQTKTSYYRSTDSGLNSSNRDGEKGDENDKSEGDKQPKPQFRDECFRKMDLMIEFTNLRNPRHCPSGVYVMPSADNFHNYPPTVQFISKLINDGGLFHPLIHPETGNFSLIQQFKDWEPHKYYIFHVLHYVKKSFKKGVLDNLSEKHIQNKDAYDTYKENPRRFGTLAKQCAELSTSKTVLYDNHNESNPIQFSELQDEKLEKDEYNAKMAEAPILMLRFSFLSYITKLKKKLGKVTNNLSQQISK
ncbi:8193_t:CDS:2, partial [Scutellospora calospora]